MTSLTFSSKNLTELKNHLEKLRKEYFKDFLFSDPLQFPRRYKNHLDREASAIISALFAYGKVRNILNFLEKIHSFLGDSPYEGLLKKRIWGVSGYRFQSVEDVNRFLLLIGEIYSEYKSLGDLFLLQKGEGEEKLRNFVITLRKRINPITRGLDNLLTIPSKKNPAKRWRLFLRWVVRGDDGLDLGLWKFMKPSDLIIPLDTHIAKNAISLNLTRRKTKDLTFALEVTEKLKRICKDDPLKYDFALVRPNILKNYLKEGKDETY